MHAIEGHGQHADLVATARWKLRHIEIALADLVGGVSQTGDGADHGESERQVESYECDQRHAQQGEHQFAIGSIGQSLGYGQWDGNDLRTYHLALLPVEAVVGAI